VNASIYKIYTADDIIDMYMPTLRTIELEVDSIEELVLILKESEASDMLRRMGYCRRRVMVFHRLLSCKTDILKVLSKKYIEEKKHKEIALYLEDIRGTMFVK
jgi:Mg2+ and Co2+ transporter CorA